MTTKRKSIKLFEHERRHLVTQYLRWRIPIDQYESRPDDLNDFIAEWNTATGRSDSAGEVVHYMRSQRKRGLWVTFDGNCQQAPQLASLNAEETETLVDVFYDNVTMLECGSDVLAYDEEISDLLVKEFYARTGRTFEPHVLIAKLTALRKRGLLPKVGKRPQRNDVDGFNDIDEAAS